MSRPLHEDQPILSISLRLNRKIAMLLFSGGVFCATLSQCIPASASASSDLKHMFGRIDRQLCHTFNVDRCQKKKRTKTGKSQPVPAPDAAAPKVAAPPDKTEKPITQPQEQKPEAVPVPKLRPVDLGPKKAVEPDPAPAPAPDVKKVVPPIPKLPPVAVVPVIPPPSVAIPPLSPPVPHPMPDNTLAGEACFAALQKLGAKFERLDTPVTSGSCSVSDPVKLSALTRDGDDLKFPDEPTLTCGFAVRFTSWVKEQAEPIVQNGLESKIVTMGTGPGYQCRGRNGDISAKLSEHAFGNAVDIERMKLANGEAIEVSNAIDTSSKYQPVLARMRATGCQYFMTVLGPGANSAHASHFHFDLERRGKKGDNKLCQ